MNGGVVGVEAGGRLSTSRYKTVRQKFAAGKILTIEILLLSDDCYRKFNIFW